MKTRSGWDWTRLNLISTGQESRLDSTCSSYGGEIYIGGLEYISRSLVAVVSSPSWGAGCIIPYLVCCYTIFPRSYSTIPDQQNPRHMASIHGTCQPSEPQVGEKFHPGNQATGLTCAWMKPLLERPSFSTLSAYPGLQVRLF